MELELLDISDLRLVGHTVYKKLDELMLDLS